MFPGLELECWEEIDGACVIVVMAVYSSAEIWGELITELPILLCMN